MLKQTQIVSAPIDLEGGAARLTVNVEGINEHSRISVEIQDREFRPVDGYGCDASEGPTSQAWLSRLPGRDTTSSRV